MAARTGRSPGLRREEALLGQCSDPRAGLVGREFPASTQCSRVERISPRRKEALDVVDECRIELSEVAIFVLHPLAPRWRRSGAVAQLATERLPLVEG